MDDLDVLRKLKVSPQDFRLTLQDLMRRLNSLYQPKAVVFLRSSSILVVQRSIRLEGQAHGNLTEERFPSAVEGLFLSGERQSE